MTETVVGAPARPAERSWRALGQIPALDGVRGIAVLLVIMTHVQVLVPFGVTGNDRIDRFIGGGYLGVDLFFVLSGFLITALLLSEFKETSNVRFGAFYARRALRLLPALYAMLAVHALYARWADLNWEQERSTIFSAVLYVANWQWEFRPFTVMRDLGLLWSLSVEEQFYLVWPAVLLALVGTRRNLRTAAIAIVLMIAAVAVWRAHLWSIGAGWPRLAVRTDTRVDSLLVGALLAVLWVGRLTPKRWVNAAAWAGAAFALWHVATSGVEDDFGYKGGLTLFAVAIAAMILGIVDGTWTGDRFFALAPLRAVGRISYGLYLWHFPIFWGVAVQGGDWSNTERVVVAFSLTVVLTLASWTFVEQPALRLKRRYRVRKTPSMPTDDPDSGEPAPTRPPWNPWLVAGALVLLGAVLLPFTFFAREPRENPALAEPDGLAFPGGDVDRTRYWGLIDLEPTFKDDFSTDSFASATPSWQIVAGSWSVDDGAATVAPAGRGEARIALAPNPVNDGVVEVNLTNAARGAGLVFRYADPGNFWAITADPDGLRWTVTQRIDGADTTVTEFVAPIYPNVAVSVTQNGSTIRFLVNGVELGRVLDPAPVTVQRSGLIDMGRSGDAARWDRFLALVPAGSEPQGS